MHFELEVIAPAALIFLYFHVHMRRNMTPEARSDTNAHVKAYFAPRIYLTSLGRKYRTGALATVVLSWIVSEIVHFLRVS